MTWFETEQIYDFLSRLENALEEWALSRYQMQSAQAELGRLHRKLNKECYGPGAASKQEILRELFGRIQQCQNSINERLKY